MILFTYFNLLSTLDYTRFIKIVSICIKFESHSRTAHIKRLLLSFITVLHIREQVKANIVCLLHISFFLLPIHTKIFITLRQLVNEFAPRR